MDEQTNKIIKLRKVAKFNGKFKDLVPMGFKFQKLFASNYRCYMKAEDEYTSYDVQVWQKQRSIELGSLFQMSYLPIKALLDGKLEQGKYERYVIDLNTGEVLLEDYKKHDAVMLMIDFEKEKGREMNDADHKELRDYLSNNFRKFVFTKEQQADILALNKNGGITI